MTQHTKRSVLVVEDNPVNRELLCAILEEDFDVYEAQDGLEGLEVLEKHYNDLSLVLLDIYMPRCDGFEFLRRKRQDERFDSTPVIVTTSSNLHEDEVECLRLGANDFIVKPYNHEIMVNRINNIIHLRESASIVNQLTWDSLTGYYRREFFYRRVQDLFGEQDTQSYDLVCCRIANFMALNDRYGKKNCDIMLAEFAQRVVSALPEGTTAGRIGNETFAFLIDHRHECAWDVFFEKASQGLVATNIHLKIGIFQKVDQNLPASVACDRSILALEQIRDSFGVCVAWYNEELRDKLNREQIILETMDDALEKHQFVVHYQPKHDLLTNAVGGAEALVRWVHPELGYVRPDHFIPLFERNGFITKLDLYVFEEACKEVKRCQELGLPVMPISANVSRLDFDDDQLAQRITKIANAYGIEHSLIHIELTETAYTENPERVVNALHELRELGFVIELDDFGSGYSSLASLNALPLDVMKLDMSIIRQAASLGDYRIVRSAIQMAGFLGLKTVAEGVETAREVEELRRLGCSMIQGYYYAPALKQDDFEAYITN